MAIGDLTAEEQVRIAIAIAIRFLEDDHALHVDRMAAVGELREALKRMDEAGAE